MPSAVLLGSGWVNSGRLSAGRRYSGTISGSMTGSSVSARRPATTWALGNSALSRERSLGWLEKMPCYLVACQRGGGKTASRRLSNTSG